MDKDTALRLALDWFKCYQDKSMSRNNAEELADEVIVTIKAALEVKDEPVAYINVEQRKLEWAKYLSWGTPTVVNLPKIPLYITPPQRTWVGLTDEERSKIWGELPQTLNPERDACVFAETIEVYLKEKNT